MDLEQKLKNQTELIKQLSEENEKLKKVNDQLSIDLTLQSTDYNKTLKKAKELIVESEKVICDYNCLIDEIKEYKENYKKAYEDMRMLKKTYQENMQIIFDKFKN